MKTYRLGSNRKSQTPWTLTETTTPTPGYGEVLIKIKAVSLNYRDLATARSESSREQLIPASDGAGEVVQIGQGVTKWKIGDRVAGNFFSDWLSGGMKVSYHSSALGGTKDGMLTEFKVLPENSIVKIPDHLSFEEASTLPCAGLTAWNALAESSAGILPGSTIVTLGTGGVSIYALQFAKKMGYQVIATSSSDTKIEKLKQLGADHVINYKTNPEWQKEVVRLTNGTGADHVIEVGGAGTLEKSLEAVRVGGTVSLIGVLTGVQGQINPFSIMRKSIRLQGIYVGSVEMFESMNQAMSAFQIKPVIEHVYNFNQANEALMKMESASHFGKIVIKTN